MLGLTGLDWFAAFAEARETAGLEKLPEFGCDVSDKVKLRTLVLPSLSAGGFLSQGKDLFSGLHVAMLSVVRLHDSLSSTHGEQRATNVSLSPWYVKSKNSRIVDVLGSAFSVRCRLVMCLPMQTNVTS